MANKGGFTLVLFLFMHGCFFGFEYAYSAYCKTWVNILLVLLFIMQQIVMIMILITDPGVAAKFRIEFEAPLTEKQAK